MSLPVARQLKSGSWTCRVRIDGQDISITRPTKREAEREARGIKDGFIAVNKVSRSAVTVGEIVDEYITYVESLPRTSPSTVRGYRMIRKNRLQPLMNTPFDEVDMDFIQDCIARETVSAKTIKAGWYLVHASILWKKKQDLKPKLPPVVDKDHPFLTPEQIPVFLDLIKGTNVELAALLGLHSLRRSEILGLLWSDIDPSRGTIYVHQTVVPGTGDKMIRREATKTVTSRRTIPILIPRLLELYESCSKETPYVYNFSPCAIRRWANQICEANNLPLIGVHGLRHTFASLAYSLRIPEKITMEWGGWSDYKVMHKIYTHIANSDKNKYAEKVKEYYTVLPSGVDIPLPL